MGELILKPEVILQQANIMNNCILKIDEYNSCLLNALSSYIKIVQDNIQEETKKIVANIKLLIDETRCEIDEKIKDVSKAASILIKTESNAGNDIND